MSKDKAEEKARAYAESVVDSTVENYMGEEIFNSQIDFISQCYLAGYNSLSTENAQLREALREILIGIEGLPPLRAIEGALEKQYIKAKQLLTDKE